MDEKTTTNAKTKLYAGVVFDVIDWPGRPSREKVLAETTVSGVMAAGEKFAIGFARHGIS